MKGLVVFIVLAAAVCIAFMLADDAEAARDTIYTLPYSITTSGTSEANPDTYVVDGTNISSTTSGITIDGDYIYLDLETDTITFGTGGGSTNRGIFVHGLQGNYARHVTIVNGWIIHDGDGEDNKCLDISWGTNLLVDGVHMKVMAGTDAADDLGGYCIEGIGYSATPSSRSAYNIEIKNCSLWNDVTQYERRDYFQACAIKLDNGVEMSDSSDYEYTWKIHDNVIVNTPHVGLLSWGRAVEDAIKPLVYIYNNHITVDGRNDLYPSYPAGQYHGHTNAYGIFLKYLGAGSQVYSNTIRSGTSHRGGRGLSMEGCHASSGNHILVHDNDINVHDGPNTEYGPNSTIVGAWGLRMRYNNKYIDAYNNAVTCSTDSDADMDDRAWLAYSFYFTSGVSSAARNCHIYNNTFTLVVDGDSNSAAGCIEMRPDSAAANITNLFENNKYVSQSQMLRLGDGNGGCLGARIVGDTLSFLSPVNDDSVTLRVSDGNDSYNSTGNYLTDMYYENGAADDDIAWSGAGGVNMDVRLRATLTVYVKSGDELPVYQAQVWAIDAYGDTVLTGATNESGVVSGIVDYKFESRLQTDSTYNDYTLKAKKNTDSTSTSYTVAWNTKCDTLTLSEAEGGVPVIGIKGWAR